MLMAAVLHSDAGNEAKKTYLADLDQINADLRALQEISPRLYDHAVNYTLGSTTSKLHELTKAAIKLAFDIGQDADASRAERQDQFELDPDNPAELSQN